MHNVIFFSISRPADLTEVRLFLLLIIIKKILIDTPTFTFGVVKKQFIYRTMMRLFVDTKVTLIRSKYYSLTLPIISLFFSHL